MKLHAPAHKMRWLTMIGAAVLAVGISLSYTHSTASDKQAAVAPIQTLIADGSESTGGKPTKPTHNRAITPTRSLLADGSESTGKPPKPKLV